MSTSSANSNSNTNTNQTNLQCSKETSAPYDPYLHRDVKHPTSHIVTQILLVKGLIGTGVFAIPHAFKQAGYIVAPIFAALIGITMTYCFHILVQSMYIMCKRHRISVLTYPMAFQLALKDGPPYLRCFAPYAVGFVNGFLLINQIGIGCVYVVFVSTNLKTFTDSWYTIRVEYYILMLFVPLFAVMLIRNLNALAPFTIFATVICCTAIIMILVELFTNMPQFRDRNAAGTILEFPLFFGTTLFALVPIGLIITLENNMKTPQSYVSRFGVLNCGMTIVTVIYIIFGVFGYVKYGDQIEDSITLNLDPNNIQTKIIQMGYSVSIGLSYALQCYVAVEIIWGNHLSQYFTKYPMLGEYAVRLAIVLITFVLAVAIPKIGMYISLFGGFCLSMVGLAIPALIQICVRYPFDLGPYNYKIIPNVILIIIGICVCITSTTAGMIDIVKFLSG
ncbi:proton-coupled amino acid transporter-like protein CG1139 [Sitodiplosis mosellana]|uniref:proton-coupled amino acid transporter-like protein CG1139 n=1 Tax=Sitodiplosis mosellana TaxID=263140 RepID=UPI002444EBAC|nr:proton-coupled amino acid transporter-like protein CG1139 [Sitodiplosis mosellana]